LKRVLDNEKRTWYKKQVIGTKCSTLFENLRCWPSESDNGLKMKSGEVMNL